MCVCVNVCIVENKENFQIAVITENMVPDIVYHLYSENLDIKLQCSLAIFKCASNKVSEFFLYELNYIHPMLIINVVRKFSSQNVNQFSCDYFFLMFDRR